MKKSEKIFLSVLGFVIIACMLVAIIQKFKNDVYDDHQEKIISVVNDGFNYDEVVLSRDCVTDLENVRNSNTGKFNLKMYQDSDGHYGVLNYPKYDANIYVDLCDYKSEPVEVVKQNEISESDVQLEVDRYWQSYGLRYDCVDNLILDTDLVYVSVEPFLIDSDIEDYDLSEYQYVGDDLYEFCLSYYDLGYYVKSDFNDNLVENIKNNDVGVGFEFSFVMYVRDESLGDLSLRCDCKIQRVSRLSELNDDNVRSVSDGKYDSVDVLVNDVRTTMEKQSYLTYMDGMLESIQGMLIEKSVVQEIPDCLCDWYVSVVLNKYQCYAYMNDVSFDEAVSLYSNYENVQQLLNSVYNDVYFRHALDIDLILEAIGSRENIVLSDNIYDEYVNNLYSVLGFVSLEDMELSMGRLYTERYVYARVVYDWLIDNCNICFVDNS